MSVSDRDEKRDAARDRDPRSEGPRRVYLDNDICSAITRGDLKPEEQTALEILLRQLEQGCLELGTSRQSLREMERVLGTERGDSDTREVREAYLSQLKAGIAPLPIAKDDHKVLGFDDQYDPVTGWTSSAPLVTDIVNPEVFDPLRAIGLKDDDAKHLMYALQNGFEVFLTCDSHFNGRKKEIEARFPSISILTPTELLEVLDAEKAH